MAEAGAITIETQSADEEVSSLCSSGLPPLILTGIFLQMLRQHFADPDEIEHPSLKDNIWTPDSKTSKIVITPGYSLNIQELMGRPAITIRRQPVSTRILGMNNRLQGGHIDPDGAESYETMHASGHILFAIARKGAEAEVLGAEVWRHFMHFQPVIRKDLNLARFQVMELSEVGRVEESAEHWATAVSIFTGYYERWQLIQEAPILKVLSIDAATQAG